MVDFPIQQGNWFSVLRDWWRHRERARLPDRATATARGSARQAISEVDLSRLAMAAPPDDEGSIQPDGPVR